MSITIPDLTCEQSEALDAICGNERLLKFMSVRLTNKGREESDDVILDRQREAIEAFGMLPESFWSFE